MVRCANLYFPDFHSFLGYPLIFSAGFGCEIGYYDNDKFANKIDRVRDSTHNIFKFLGLPVARLPCPGASGDGVRRGFQEVMPPWPEDI
jgi:hypothetical protein